MANTRKSLIIGGMVGAGATIPLAIVAGIGAPFIGGMVGGAVASNSLMSAVQVGIVMGFVLAVPAVNLMLSASGAEAWVVAILAVLALPLAIIGAWLGGWLRLRRISLVTWGCFVLTAMVLGFGTLMAILLALNTEDLVWTGVRFGAAIFGIAFATSTLPAGAGLYLVWKSRPR